MSQRSAAAVSTATAPASARADAAGRRDAGLHGAAPASTAPAPLLVPVMPPAPPRTDDAAIDFCRISHGAPRIHDADAVRAQLTAQLLRELGQAFGLDLSRLQVTVTAGAAARLDARGANGLQEGRNLLLHPGRYRPAETSGRYLLAHEATHAAQRVLDGAAPVAALAHTPALAHAPTADDALAAAEAEADRLGSAFAERRSLARPRVPLRSLDAVADTGKSAVQPAAAQTDAPPLTDVVKTSRSRELAMISDALDGWWVSDGDVFKVMRLLDTVEFNVAVAMVGALPRDHRYWLADNINPPHMYRHRRSVLASYQALEPERFDAIDLKVLRALPDGGLDLEETQALIYTIGNLPAEAWEELHASEKGEAISKMVGGYAPDPDQQARLAQARKDAAGAEAKLAGERKLLLAHASDQGANALVAEVRQRLRGPIGGGGQPRHPLPGDALAVLDLLEGAMADAHRFGYIAEALESAGLIDQLLDLLPPQAFIGDSTSSRTRTLTALVQTRLPIKNEALLEDLLSYSWRDWAIRDHEALFAYKLLTALPMPVQYQFRQRDGGKFYLRLIDNLPRDEKTGLLLPVLEIRKAGNREELERLRLLGARTATMAGDWRASTDSYYYNASDLQQQRLDQGDARKQLQALISKFEAKRKGIYRDGEAIELYGEVARLGAGSLAIGQESAGDQALREAFMRELDSRGFIDELFSQLPDAFLFDQAHRVDTVKIMLARDPLRVQAQARELVSRHLFSDWMVSDEEAYLAFQCIKALPDDERQAFIRDNPDLWARIHAEMSPSMRQARDINAYIGDKEGTDRASVLSELAEPGFWTADNEVALDGALRMAMAMAEHRFAFERSRQFRVVERSPALAGLIERYRLWNPAAGRDDYQPEMLKGTRWHEEGLFASLKSFWGGLVTLWNMDVLFVDGKIGAKVDLNDVQRMMGGDLMGLQLANPAKRGSQQPAAGKDANQLTLLLDPDWLEGKGKSAELILPQLLIDSSNVQMEGSTVQTGEVDLRNLHIRAAYDAQNQGQAAQAQVSVDSLVAHDLLLAKGTAMYTIARLVVSTLRLAAGSLDSSKGAPPAARKGRYIPFPLLVLAVLPWLAQLAALGLMAVGVKKARGLGDQGLEPDSRFAGDLASRVKAIDMSFASLSAEGFASSGGQRIGHAEVQDFALHVGLNKATRLRAELASISARKAALQGKPDAANTLEALDARSAELQRQRAAVERQEQQYLAIQARIRAGGLGAPQQKQLQQELDQLDFEDKGGAFLDIGKVEVAGVEGNLTSAKPIVLNNLHGQGSSTALMGFLSGPTATPAAIARTARSLQHSPAPAALGQGDLSIDLGDVHTGRLEVAGGVRTVKDIDAKLKELGDVADRPELRPLVESLQLMRPKARRYEAMVAIGLSSLSAAELEEFRGLRKLLGNDAALIIESLDLTRARLDVDLGSGRVGLGADGARIQGLQLPQQGISVEQITAAGIRAGALPANSLLDWSDWKKHLRDAELGMDSLQIDNARSKYHGLLFEKATLTGAYAKVKQRGNLVEAGLDQLNIAGLGLAPRLGLLSQRLRGLREKAKVAASAEQPALAAEIAKLSALVSDLQQLADQRHRAYLRLQHASTPDEIRAAKDAVADADGVIALNLAQYGVANADLDAFGVRATGAGDVLSDVLGGGFDPVATLERGGVAITGTGPEQRLFKRLALHNAQTVGDQPGSSLSAETGAFEIGETRLGISARKEGDSLFVDVARFDIDSLSLQQFLLTSSEGDAGVQIWSDGRSGLDKLQFKGSLRMDARVPGSRELADYRLASVHIEQAEIGRLYGAGLGFAMLDRKLEVQIKSGSINGIRSNQIDVAFPEDPAAAPKITGTGGKTATVGIDSIDKLVIGKALVGAWSGSGRLDAKSISVGLLEDGGIQAQIGDLDLSNVAVRGPDGWARLSLRDLGGKITYRNGALDIDDIHFGTLDVPALHWKVGASGFVEADQPVTIQDVRVKGRVETSQAETGTKQSQVDLLKISELHVGSVQAKHLVYQDEDNRVELGVPDVDLPKHMRGFAPLQLKNLNVWDVEWTREKKFVSGHAKLDKYEMSTGYENLKSGMKAGVALTGKGMTAQVDGPGEFGIDIGRIDKVRGSYHDKKIDSKFLTGNVVGSIVLGPDFVEANNVQVDGINIGLTTYVDPPQTLKLGGAVIEKIKLGKVRQNYAKSTDPAKHGEKVPTTLEIHDLDLQDLVAGSFIYDGSSHGVSATGEAQSSTQHVTGKHVTLQHLNIGSFVYDSARAQSVLGDLSVDSGDKRSSAYQPFGVRGLSATLVSKLGDKQTTTKLLTNIEGGPLSAEKITFGSVKLGTTVGKDGKPQDITRSTIDGAFTLSRLGLINPDLTLTDEKGNITKVSAYEYGSIELRNLHPQFLPNNTIAISLESLAANRIQLQRGKGGEIKPGDLTVKVPFAEIRDIAMGIKGMGTQKGFELLGAKIGTATASKVQVDLAIDRTVQGSKENYAERLAAYREALKQPSHALIAEPLSGMQGDAEVEVEHVNLFHVPLVGWGVNLPWDPNLRLPIRGGRINFDHVSPYAVNITQGHLTLGNFGPNPDIGPDLPADLPGVHGDAGEHGMLDLRELVEGLFSAPPSEPEYDPKPAADLSGLRNLNFGVRKLALGNGKLGMDLTDDKQLGPGDVYLDVQREGTGQNELTIPWQHVGDDVELRMPHFHAKGAGFADGKTGAVDMLGIYVRIGDLAAIKFTVHVWVESATIKDIEIGDVSLTHAAALGLQKAPEAKDMPPEAKP